MLKDEHDERARDSLTLFKENKMIAVFEFYLALGFSLIPIRPMSKQPAVNWKEFTERMPTADELASWTRFGVGLVMGRISGFVAVDADTKENARKLFKLLPPTTMVTLTPNGGHFFFRTTEMIRSAVKTLVKGIACDIRAEGSYVVAAPSIHPSGKPYQRWGSWTDAPMFDESWVERSCQQQPSSSIRDIERYLATIKAVSARIIHQAV